MSRSSPSANNAYTRLNYQNQFKDSFDGDNLQLTCASASIISYAETIITCTSSLSCYLHTFRKPTFISSSFSETRAQIRSPSRTISAPLRRHKLHARAIAYWSKASPAEAGSTLRSRMRPSRVAGNSTQPNACRAAPCLQLFIIIIFFISRWLLPEMQQTVLSKGPVHGLDGLDVQFKCLTRVSDWNVNRYRLRIRRCTMHIDMETDLHHVQQIFCFSAFFVSPSFGIHQENSTANG